MGRDLHFRGGSFYRKDDRTGFPTRAEQTRKEWNGLIVSERVWEPRQPQDLVRGVKDQQNVPEARPLPPNVFIGPKWIALAAAAAPGATVLQVQSTAGFFDGCSVSVMQDDGVNFNTTLVGAPGASSIALAHGLQAGAASGNLVTNNTSTVPANQEPV